MSSASQKNTEDLANANYYKEYQYENGKVLRLTKDEFDQIVKAFLALHKQKQLLTQK